MFHCMFSTSTLLYYLWLHRFLFGYKKFYVVILSICIQKHYRSLDIFFGFNTISQVYLLLQSMMSKILKSNDSFYDPQSELANVEKIEPNMRLIKMINVGLFGKLQEKLQEKKKREVMAQKSL